MRIHLDNVNFFSKSGPNTFASRLAEQLVASGHDVELHDGRLADVSLVFIEPSGAPLAKKFLQRLDGIWSKAGDEGRNDGMRALYERASGVVFQSRFDQRYITGRWGDVAYDVVINNGVELARFDDAGAIEQGIRQIRDAYEMMFVCSANWHRSKRLRENIELFSNIRKHHPSSCLVVMGANPDWIVSDPDVYYVGSLGHHVCLQCFSVADWMLHLAYFEHCPNTVVEALSQGCPVICTDVGGTQEIVKDFGAVLHEPTPFDFNAPCEYDNPPALDLTVAGPLPERSALGEHANVDIAHVAQRYVDFFKRLV